MASVALSLLLTAAPARADDSEQTAIKQLQAQIRALQKQLDKVSAAQANAVTAVPGTPTGKAASSAAPSAEPANGGTTSPSGMATTTASSGGLLPDTLYKNGGTKVTVGGYIEADGIYRSKNESADVLTNFNTSIPFNNSVNSHQGEFRETARASRLSLLAEGNPDDQTKLIGYLEADFLGAATTANSVETNSYNPRLRQGFVGYENSGWGLNVYAGQMWSLATLYKNGLNPRQEALPQTIDIALLPGYTYERGPEFRVVKELMDKQVSVGFAAVSPQVNFGGIATPGTVTATNAGQASTISASPSTDVAPDLIAKVAFDPGFGHYEAFGIGRFFHDNVNSTLHNNTVFTGGGGVGAVIPVVEKMVDVQGNFMVGQGIGRYGPALLPDYAFAPNGAIKPLTEYMGSLGVITHPLPTWTAYFYGGAEKVLRMDTGANTAFGYGDYALNNSGCNTINGTCQAQTSTVWQVTGGFWKDLYKGSYGNMKVGLQDSLTRRDAFSDSAGRGPHSYENTVLTAIRYSPF
jgi:hypothetical protein